jgi:hypothetical protein
MWSPPTSPQTRAYGPVPPQASQSQSQSPTKTKFNHVPPSQRQHLRPQTPLSSNSKPKPSLRIATNLDDDADMGDLYPASPGGSSTKSRGRLSVRFSEAPL